MLTAFDGTQNDAMRTFLLDRHRGKKLRVTVRERVAVPVFRCTSLDNAQINPSTAIVPS